MGKPGKDPLHTYLVSQSTPEVQFYPAQRCVSLQQNPLNGENDSQFHFTSSNRILKAESDNPPEDETKNKSSRSSSETRVEKFIQKLGRK